MWTGFIFESSTQITYGEPMPSGRRERKKRATRHAIAQAALRLFAERGYEHVTLAEIAEAADIARVTLFNYFPTKESLVLDTIGDENPAGVVAERAPGVSALAALKTHYSAFATNPGLAPGEDLLASVRVITSSPQLTAAAQRHFDAQREALAQTLVAESASAPDDLTPHLAAALISSAIRTLKMGFFHRLACGMPAHMAAARLPADVDTAFDLLEHGIGERYTRLEEPDAR
jgi:AcrR family transcriptional regulator